MFATNFGKHEKKTEKNIESQLCLHQLLNALLLCSTRCIVEIKAYMFLQAATQGVQTFASMVASSGEC